MSKDKNELLILYSFYDFIKFIEDLKMEVEKNGEDTTTLQQQLSATKAMITLYLETIFSIEQVQSFTNKLQQMNVS